MIRHLRFAAAGIIYVAALFAPLAYGDEYDPPAGYYSTAIGTGATLKSQLNDIIDGHTTRSYDQIRIDLQTTDAVPGDPSKIYVVYNNRVPITKPTGGSIPGWDNGVTWNREHSWPQDRGVDATSAPDGSDMHHVFPSKPSDNTVRDNNNFGGAFGQQPRGLVNDGGTKYYAGDLDAGLIARAQFYMAVRYDGTDAGTADLELVAGNPVTGGTTMGDLNRLIEWHFAAPPDTFERRRNDVIFENYQHNRNPFIDRPEFVWSVFVDQANDSRLTVSGGTTDANGASVRNIDYGRVFKNDALPTTSTALVLNKAGLDGTYYEVTTAGQATSTVVGRNNAFRTNVGGDRNVTVGLSTDTATVGLRSGTVTIDNLDITTGGGAGRGANDGNDTINLSLTVLDHATPSFADDSTVTMLSYDFGTVTTASVGAVHLFDVFNRGTTPAFTADMDFDSVLSSGDTSILRLPSEVFAGVVSVAGGDSEIFSAQITPTAAGTFAASYTMRFSDEDIPGAQNNIELTLNLSGSVVLAGDFNRDNFVDAADYVVWLKTNGSSTTAFSGADADGNEMVDAADLEWWRQNFGMTAGSGGGGVGNVPEPAGMVIGLIAALLLGFKRRRSLHT